MAEVAGQVTARLQSFDLHPFAVRSRGGNGIHLWLLFAAPVSAATLRAFLIEEVIKPLGFTEGAGKGVAGGQIEVFPKQAKVRANGVGNPICLSFAGRSCALDVAFSPVSEDRIPSLTINSPSAVNAFEPAGEKQPKEQKSRRKPYFDEANLRDALGSIRTTDGQTWVNYGLAIRQSAAEAGFSDEEAYGIRSDWSELHGYTDAATEVKRKQRWAGFKVGEASDESLMRIGTIYHDAAQAGWKGHPEDGADRLIMYPPHKGMEAIMSKIQSALVKLGQPIHQRGGRLCEAAFRSSRTTLAWPVAIGPKAVTSRLRLAADQPRRT